jgi:hypothetical protein
MYFNRIRQVSLLIDHHLAQDGAEQSRPARSYSRRLDVDVATIERSGTLYVQHRPVDGVVEARNETAHVSGHQLIVRLLLLLTARAHGCGLFIGWLTNKK